jgi:hypothetical protein
MSTEVAKDSVRAKTPVGRRRREGHDGRVQLGQDPAPEVHPARRPGQQPVDQIRAVAAGV